jgi:hypothetical protein
LVGAQDAPPAADDPGLPARQEDRRARPTARRWWAAAAWAGGGLALFAFFLRISLGSRVDSDGANNALQAWDMLHGHVLLHGWVIGDATFYFFELPLLAISELFFGLANLAFHVASALTYLIVAVCAVALAVTDSRGAARAARCAVVVTVLAVPLFTTSAVTLLLEEPDHIGTSVFLLASFLLIDRIPARWFTAPLVCLILCAGQLSDMTVRYVAVPAIVLICGYRVLAERRLRSGEAALVVAAVASVPLEALLRTVMLHLGAYTMVPPQSNLAPVRQWPHHVVVTWLNLRTLFGAFVAPDTKLGGVAAAFGVVCLLAAGFGLVRVAWTWRAARRAEQLLFAAIICNIGVYVVSVIATSTHSREIVAVLPCGAVLAARACVPARMAGTRPALLVVAAAALAALLPLAAAATQPTLRPASVPLAAWLEAHGLTYGISGYWDGSVTTAQSGDRVQIRAVDVLPKHAKAYVPRWEANSLWYDPSRHNATFVVADHTGKDSLASFERLVGKPAVTYRVASWFVMVYRTNLLPRLAYYPGQPVPAGATPASSLRPAQATPRSGDAARPPIHGRGVHHRPFRKIPSERAPVRAPQPPGDRYRPIASDRAFSPRPVTKVPKLS